MKGLEELGVADKDTGLGEVSSEVIRDVLQGGSSGGVALRFGDVGPDPRRELNSRHLATTHCTKGAERKFQCLSEEDLWEST